MIRLLEPADRASLKSIVERVTIFNSDDVDVAMELIDKTINEPDQTDYVIRVNCTNGAVTGYYCIGLRPLTDGVYDLYWIVVDPETSGKGCGSSLLHDAFEYVASRKGRWLLAETSSKDVYTLTRRFYEKNNMDVIYAIPDFYRLGEALITYAKQFKDI